MNVTIVSARGWFTAALILAGGLAVPGTTQAAMLLNFSDISSDATAASALRAQVIFQTSGDHLIIGINNQSNYRIGGLYFNSDASLTGLAFTSPPTPDPDWRVYKNRQAGGSGGHLNMGTYGWALDFGLGNDRLGSGWTYLHLRMTGTTSEFALGNRWSSNGRAIATIEFEGGPGGDMAFGGTRTPGINPAPEPSTGALALSGLAALGLAWLRRFGAPAAAAAS